MGSSAHQSTKFLHVNFNLELMAPWSDQVPPSGYADHISKKHCHADPVPTGAPGRSATLALLVSWAWSGPTRPGRLPVFLYGGRSIIRWLRCDHGPGRRLPDLISLQPSSLEVGHLIMRRILRHEWASPGRTALLPLPGVGLNVWAH